MTVEYELIPLDASVRRVNDVHRVSKGKYHLTFSRVFDPGDFRSEVFRYTKRGGARRLTGTPAETHMAAVTLGDTTYWVSERHKRAIRIKGTIVHEVSYMDTWNIAGGRWNNSALTCGNNSYTGTAFTTPPIVRDMTKSEAESRVTTYSKVKGFPHGQLLQTGPRLRRDLWAAMILCSPREAYGLYNIRGDRIKVPGIGGCLIPQAEGKPRILLAGRSPDRAVVPEQSGDVWLANVETGKVIKVLSRKRTKALRGEKVVYDGRRYAVAFFVGGSDGYSMWLIDTKRRNPRRWRSVKLWSDSTRDPHESRWFGISGDCRWTKKGLEILWAWSEPNWPVVARTLITKAQLKELLS